MRWNCPHCGIALAVADEKLGAGWSFSKCYKCSGFALVRRSDVSLIKIDQAPAGEKMILPESSEIPLMNRQATERLRQYTAAPMSTDATPIPQQQQQHAATARNTDKPVIRRAIRRRAAAAPAPQTQAQAQETHSTSAPAQQPQNTLPVPAAAAPAQTIAPPMGIGATAAGPAKPAYKIPQQRPRIETRGVNIPYTQVPTQQQSAIIEVANSLPEPLPEDPQISLARRLIPVAIAASALLAVGSGVYLYIQAQRVWDRARDEAQTRVAPPQSHAERQIEQPAAAPAPMLAHQPETTQPNKAAPAPITTDQVHQNAMAPLREEAPEMKEEDTPPSALVVRANAANVKLRKGPGLQFAVMGLANPGVHYVVQEWKADWFRVTLPAAPVDEKTGKAPSAWVRNDLVSLITVD